MSVSRIHVAPGPSAGGSLKVALRPVGDLILVCQDVLSHGPLPSLDSIDRWVEVRQEYLRRLWREPDFQFEGWPGDLLANRDRLRAADRITLWIGTGLAEQLLLAWLVDLLARLNVDRARLHVAQFTYSGRHEVLGLGMVPPEKLMAHPGAQPLPGAMLDVLAHAWLAVIAPDPGMLLEVVQRPVKDLPWLHRALACLLLRFPDAGHGLNIWEFELLRQAHAEGPKVSDTIGFTLGAATDWDMADWAGDDYLLDRLRRLGHPGLLQPLLTLTGDEGPDPRDLKSMRVDVTASGRDVLEGRANAVELNGIDDWVGGVHLQSSSGRVWFHRDGTLVRA